MERFYIYKLIFESGATYVGQHTQRKENDNYITSSRYYKRHPEDKLLERKILIDNLPDKERMDIFETILICQDKAENPKNVNYNLGQWCTHFYRGGWNKGLPGYNKGKHLSEETKRKLSEQRKGKSFEERFGKERAEEIKRKISEAQKGIKRNLGKKASAETKQKMSAAHKGKKHSPEWNKKVGDAQRGKPKSKEAIEKMRLAQKGKKLSEEHKNNIAKSQTGGSFWNNGVICKRFKKGEEPIGKDGWERGRLDIPWNKGKKMSEEARKKLSESCKGRVTWNKKK